MLTLSVKIRKTFGRKVKLQREKGVIPAVLYGPKLKKAQSLELDEKIFNKIYQEAGESSLISLQVEGESKEIPVLIHEIQLDPLSDKIIHVDFYQVSLETEIVAKISLVFEGIAPAVKDLGGTLVKNISEVEVKALPQKLPKDIKVDVGNLKSFEDNVLIEDLELPEGVKILKEPKEIVAAVLPPEKVEEELQKPVEEKVEEVEKAEEKKTDETVEEE